MASLDTRSTIAAYFATHAAAENAVNDLKQAGFKPSQIGYAGRTAENYNAAETAYENPASSTSDPAYNSATSTAGSTTTSTVGSTTHAAAAKVGEKTEGAWAKIKNFFEGGDVEPYADERDRGSVNAREITDPSRAARNAYGTGLETGAAGSDYDTEDLHGSFSNLSIPEEHSRYFGHRLGRGDEGAVVTVYAESRAVEAEEILTRNGGDLGADAANYNYGNTAEATGTADTGTQRIQLLGEVLRVHKDRIQRGEVRLRKEVITEQQTISVPVSREELILERVAGDGSTPVTGTIGSDKEIRIPLSEEKASVAKDTVVREQVSVGKRNVEETRNLNASVEHEELRVENEGLTDKDRI